MVSFLYRVTGILKKSKAQEVFMKKSMIFSFSVLLIAICLLASCNADNANRSIFGDSDKSPTQTEAQSDYEATLKSLENKILTLQQSQYISESEYQKELELLQKELEKLSAGDKTTTDSGNETTAGEQQEAKFLYTVRDGKALITGYTGKVESLVIPNRIDDYEVTAISGNAFSDPMLKTVWITDGISEIDWFAFDGCTALEAITIPQSVSSIGYSAFQNVGSHFTIYCQSGSFAQSYAQSYGLSYTII